MKSPTSPTVNDTESGYHELNTKTRKEMANELDLSLRTFYRRLKKIGYKSEHRLLTPKQQNEIKKLLGYD